MPPSDRTADLRYVRRDALNRGAVEKFLINNIPGPALAVLFIAVAIGAGLAGLFIVRRSVALATLEQHNDVAGFIIAVVGVLYAVVLGFVVVIIWQQFDTAQSNAHHEAITLEILYNDASAFGKEGQAVQRDVLAYGTSVVNQEWPELRDKHQGDPATDALLDKVWADLQTVRAPDNETNAFLSSAVTSVNSLEEERSQRIDDSSRQLPLSLWAVLLLGAMITVGFTYFFGVSNLAAHAMMVAALSAIIGIALFLALSLDLPYSGDLGIKPTAMRHTIEDLRASPQLPAADH
jgi:hypothetical protein